MKFRIGRTSDGFFGNPPKPYENATAKGKSWEIEINALNELIELSRNDDLIIRHEPESDYKFWLEIYDGYRE